LGSLKWKKMSWTKLTTCLEPILAKGLASTMTSRWVKPPGAFLKGPMRSMPHTTKGHVMGMVWSPWVGAWINLPKYWHPIQDRKIWTTSLAVVGK
jgi:hypothetical protein